jgi:hypothetical protein
VARKDLKDMDMVLVMVMDATDSEVVCMEALEV